ncbi:hypothetical protein PG985_011872 [Apiospora marii]|uniref:uncharacterized protein n=1 Tax=Apiospora marii TaxID=335849 RepID=UPI00312E7D39
MAGFLVPPHYHDETPNSSETNIVSIIFGFCISLGFFTATKAGYQTWDAYKRGKIFNAYIIVIFFWCMQIQFILQIIINQIALLMVPVTKAAKVRWSVAAIVGAINISGFFIWIPARLQISPIYVETNVIWDKAEKGVFLAVDLSLNIYFIHLVRSRLLANGLTKYNRLFHFNICMVIISVLLDAVLMGATFMPSLVVYLQFHPLTYLMKLYIEMNVASLIVKVVRDTSVNGHSAHGRPHKVSQYYRTADHEHHKMVTCVTANRARYDPEAGFGHIYDGSVESDGIRKTVETQIVHHGKAEDDGVSETSSTTNILI